MESLVMVACTLSFTFGYPTTDVTSMQEALGLREVSHKSAVYDGTSTAEPKENDEVNSVVRFSERIPELQEGSRYHQTDDQHMSSATSSSDSATVWHREHEGRSHERLTDEDEGRSHEQRLTSQSLRVENSEQNTDKLRIEGMINENEKTTRREDLLTSDTQTSLYEKSAAKEVVSGHVTLTDKFTALVTSAGIDPEAEGGSLRKNLHQTDESHVTEDVRILSSEPETSRENNEERKHSTTEDSRTIPYGSRFETTDHVTGTGNGKMSETPSGVYQGGWSDEGSQASLAAIVDALEKLGILDSEGRWCYTMDRITKSAEKSAESSEFPVWKVELLIRTRPLSSSPPPVTASMPLRTRSRVRTPGSAVENVTSDISGEDSKRGVALGCSDWNGTDCIPEAANGTTGNASLDTSGHEGQLSHNRTAETPKFGPKVTGGQQLTDNGVPLRPSRTQILVISTCSTVIGLFFIVALIMRIRNYLKRTRSLNKHRTGVRHHRAPITSALLDPSSSSALPPPSDANQKENTAASQKDTPPSAPAAAAPARPKTRLFGRRCAGERVASSTPKMPVGLRRQSELTRLFVSQKSQREAAKEYIRQLSLTCPPPNIFFGGERTSDSPDSPIFSPTANKQVNSTEKL